MTLVGGPGVDVAEQVKLYDTKDCWTAGLLVGVMAILTDWALPAWYGEKI